MSQKLNKIEETETELGNNTTDASVMTGKALLSLIPFLGSFFAEFIAFTIPQQRQDRLENFVRLLAHSFYEFEGSIDDQIKGKIEAKLNDPQTAPFVEKVLKKVIESESEAKRQFLASILKNGLVKDIEIIKRERLLKTFGELNEIEILRLYGASIDDNTNEVERNAFFDKYENDLFYEPDWDAPEEEIEKGEMIIEYSRHLIRLGLMDKTNIDAKATPFGKALIKFIEAEKYIDI